MKAEATLEGVTEEINALRDLFQRRLLDDKAKNRLYDQLYEQVGFARDGLVREYLKPLLTELLLVVDRVKQFEDVNPIALSVVEELGEILGRRGVRPVATSGPFDPTIHEAARTEDSEFAQAGSILAVLRDGYYLDGSLLRPAAVVVSAGEAVEAGIVDGRTEDEA